jgi:hypothetical protein
MTTSSVPAPLFRDPVYDGAADPVLIWNIRERSWWMMYTARRATVECNGYAWVHGTDIGVASSSSGGAAWLYRGTIQGLEFERGRNTFWAPEIILHKDIYHMYVSYVRGVPTTWDFERDILHYTSRNLWDWKLEGRLDLSSHRVIDACVHALPDGRWRMWYKDESAGSHTFAADSKDLSRWKVRGPVITDCAHEGPNVFFWKGSYWMITDPWQGLGVYRSKDAESWSRQENILDRPGTRKDDGNIGNHADILVQGDQAFIFYFVHPGMSRTADGGMPESMPYASRRSSLQAAELELRDGVLRCNRDAPLSLDLTQ